METQTTQSTTSSNYQFVPSTLGATASAELSIAWTLMQGMTSYIDEMTSMLKANLSFAQESAKDMIQAGKEQLYEAIATGAGEMFSGAVAIGGAALCSSYKKPEIEKAPPAPENSPALSENANATEMRRLDRPTAQENQQNLRTQQEHQQSVKEVNERNQTRAEQADRDNKLIQSRNDKILQLSRGIGEAGKAVGDTLRGVFQRYEANYQAEKTLADNGQQSSKGMVDQFMQMWNSSMSSLNSVYQTMVQIAQANNTN